MEVFRDPFLTCFVSSELAVNIAPGPVPDDSWRGYCDWARLVNQKEMVRGSLTWAPTHVLSTRQRRMLAETDPQNLMSSYCRVAVITDSIRVRGALIAYAWLSKAITEVRGFSPAAPLIAIDWLREKLEFDVERVRTEIEAVAALGEFAPALGAYP